MTVSGLFIMMLLIGIGAFAPLAYFIYKYNFGDAKPFGDTEPHGDSPSVINDFAEKVIFSVKGLLHHH